MTKKYNVDRLADALRANGLIPADTTDDKIVGAAPAAADDNRGPDPDDFVVMPDGTLCRRRWLEE